MNPEKHSFVLLAGKGGKQGFFQNKTGGGQF
jgi:hypothetical protein